MLRNNHHGPRLNKYDQAHMLTLRAKIDTATVCCLELGSLF